MSNFTMPKDQGYGIAVDKSSPTFPWHDITGKVQPKSSGAGTPTRTLYRGNIYDYSFVANDIVDLNYHMPHDYAMGTDVFIHVHWSHNGTNISGNAVFTLYHTWAKGHNQAIFPADKTVTISYNTTDLATTPRYQHRIDEVQLSMVGGSATLLDTNTLEPDGLFLIQLKLTTLPTITGGNLFIHTADMHYQSTCIGTKQKSPPFWT